MYFFTISKNIISPVGIKKNFLWKLVVALIILQKSFCEKLSWLIKFWDSELHSEFQLLKILYFSFKILTKLRIFTCLKITIIFRLSYCHQCSHFFQKLFSKIINATTSFHKKNIFLIQTGEMIFFDMGKKYTIFVQKFITQKILKIQKKILHHEKV